MVMILKYALEQTPAPIPLTRYIIGVPLYARLQIDGKGNVITPPRSKKRFGKLNEYRERLAVKRRVKVKTETDENQLKKAVGKDELELKTSVNCHWSDSTDIIIPSALSNKNNPMLNKRDSPQKTPKNSSSCRKAIKFNQPTLNGGTLPSSSLPIAPRESSIVDAQSLMHAASCLGNDLPLLLNENDLGTELHPNLDIHTGPSIELQTEQNLLNPSFNMQISPNFNLDLSPAVSFTSSPVVTPKKERKRPKKNKIKEKSETETKTHKSATAIKNTNLSNETASNLQPSTSKSSSRNNIINVTPITSLNSLSSLNNKVTEVNDKNSAAKIKKNSTVKEVKVAHTLEEIVKAQEQLRSKLKFIHDTSFRCDNVKCLEEIADSLKALSDKLKSSLPPAKRRRMK